MNFSTQQIEAIVQRVIGQLMTRGVDVRQGRAPANHAPAGGRSLHGDTAMAASDTALLISGKVVTEECLATANAAGRAVRLQTGAIVTPSGHDFIRRNSVIVAGFSQSDQVAATTGRVIAASCHAAVSAAATAGWMLDQVGCEREAARIAHAHPTQRTVCCVDVPSITACLLNRRANTRAAVLEPTAATEQLLTQMNPQVLVLESSRWSFTALLRLLKQLSRFGLNTPDGWEEV
ncbi:MAG: hypothetical protein NXI04_27295 [Planctomycetaceae bacterium]|nr:hypothetical protein [Planctomycetaceae bacterium]